MMDQAKPNLLEVSDLVKHFDIRGGLFRRKVGAVRAVEGVSLHLRGSEVLGLAGESGSGKTTIGRAILRLVEPTAGSVRFEGREVTSMSRRDLKWFRRRAQIIFQDPSGSLDPRMTVKQSVEEPLRTLGLETSKSRREERVMEALRTVVLGPEYASRYPSELSGGQLQRVAIARAIVCDPSFIVADEPVSALDVSIQAQIVNLLARLREKLSLSVLFISHDLAVMQHLADRIAVAYLGRIMEVGTADEICSDPQHPYTRALLSAIPDPDPASQRKRIVLEGDQPNPADAPTGCVFRTRCWLATKECAEKVPELRSASPTRRVACLKV